MDVDYRTAFDLAPVGLCLSRNRGIVDCNQAVSYTHLRAHATDS